MQALPLKYETNWEREIQKHTEVALSRWEIHKILFERFALLRVCNYCQFLPKDMLKGPTILVRLLMSASYIQATAFGIHKEDGAATQFLKGGSEQT